MVRLPDEGVGDEGHGTETPELDHGEKTDEVGQLGVLGCWGEDGMDGMHEEFDGGRARSIQRARAEQTDDFVCIAFVEQASKVVHVTTRTVTRM